MLRILPLSTAAAVLLVQPAAAQNPAKLTQQEVQQEAQKPQSEQDRKFAEEAAQGGMLEVELGQLAADRAESEEVREFGQMMVDDHGQANQKLADVAQRKEFQLPQELSDEGKQQRQELEQLSGAEFDRQYVDLMVEDHQKDVESFRTQVQSGEDADLVEFAEETLPTLQGHLDAIRQIQEQVVAGQQPSGAEPEAQQELAPQLPQEGIGADVTQEVIGTDVKNGSGEDIGKVEDVVIDQEQNVYAVVSVGGFLGIGGKEVAIPMDVLKPGPENDGLVTAMTKEELEGLPDYERGQFPSLWK
jgi:putative membrane protein